MVIAQDAFFRPLHLRHKFSLFTRILAATSDNRGVIDLNVGTDAFACEADEIRIVFAFGIEAVAQLVHQDSTLFAFQKDMSLEFVGFGADITFSFQQ